MSEGQHTNHLLRQKINENKIQEAILLLERKDVRIHELDENGMTFLDLAAYKGSYELSKILIERGVNVNSNQHVNGYTALMFAALAGNEFIVNLLLESGANLSLTNTVSRNASQMAAFVGQHSVVTLMNNFIKIEEIEVFSEESTGVEKKALLEKKVIVPLHQFIRQTNIHPIRLLIRIDKIIVKKGKQVVDVLNRLSKKQVENCNEMLAFKYHYLSYFLNYILKELEIHKTETISWDEWFKHISQLLIRNWLKGSELGSRSHPLEIFLRKGIMEFPYHDLTLFIQMVQVLHNVKVGDEPSALTVLQQTINGQKFFDDNNIFVCEVCGELDPPKKCSNCKKTKYCDEICQKIHWFLHKKSCVA